MEKHFTSLRRALGLTALCTALFLTAQPGRAADSPAASKDEMASPSRLLARLWRKTGTFTKVYRATLIGDTLYVAGTPRGLEAVDVATGLPRWMHLGEYPVDVAPTVKENIVYTVEGGRFVSIDATTGTELTRTKSKVGSVTPVYPGEHAWVIGSGDGHVYGLGPGAGRSAGRKVWRVLVDDFITASTWDGDKLAYFLNARGAVYAASVPAQKLAWHYQLRKPACSPLALSGGVVYVGCEDYYLYALDAASGSVRWRVVLAAPVLDAPVVVGSRLYVATKDGVLHAVDTETHSEVWSNPNAGRVLTTTPDHLIFLRVVDGVNHVGVADAATGQVISEATAMHYETFAAAPEKGVFYAVSKNGDVLAVGDRAAMKAAEQAAEKAAHPAAPAAEAPAPVKPAEATVTTTTLPPPT